AATDPYVEVAPPPGPAEDHDERDEREHPPGPREHEQPPGPGEDHAEHDWKKIEEDARKGHVEPALHKLDDWERRYGASAETEEPRRQLEAMPRGRGKHH